MTDKLIATDGTSSGLSAGAAISDTDYLEMQQTVVSPASTVNNQFSAVKTWIKSWIAKADVGLGNVSNNAQLTIANNLSDVNSALTSRANLSLSSIFKTYLTGKYYIPPNITVGGSTAVSAANRMHLIPFMLPRSVTIDRFFVRVTGGSSGNWQGAVYNSSATTYMPTTLVGNGGSGSTTTGSTNTESLLSGGSGSSIPLNEGTLYWLAFNSDNGIATYPAVLGGGANLANVMIGDATSTNVINGGTSTGLGYYTPTTFGTWTSDITGNTFTIIVAGCPVVGFKVA